MAIDMRVLSALRKVFLDEEPIEYPEEPMPGGFQNETISFQVAYKPDSASAGARGFLSLRIDSPIRECIRARRVMHVPVGLATFADADANYLRRTPGLYPDLLIDVDNTRLRLYGDQWHSLWFDVEPTSQTLPGIYPVQIELLGEDGAILGSAHISVQIFEGALPPQTLRNTRWLHCDCLSQYYGEPMWTERYWAIVESFIRHAVRRGINMILTPIHTPPLDTEVGGERLTNQLVDITMEGGAYRFGFKKLRRWVDMCLRCGVEYFEMAHLFTQWGAKYTPKIVATVDGTEQRIFGWDVPAQGGAYGAFLAQYLPALTDELKRLGVADKTYFHISDEPSEEHLPDYMAAKALATPWLEGFTVIDALSDIAFYQQGVIAKPIPANDHIQPFLDAGVEGLWTYYCIGQYKDVANVFMAMPSARNRVFGIQLYKYNIEGILQWAYNFYNSQYSVYHVDPFAITDADGFTPSGDAFQVYPGADGTPLDSLRLLVTQQALYDLRACQWLEALTDREYVLSLIEDGLQKPLTFSEYPRSDGYLLSLRARINREIAARRPNGAIHFGTYEWFVLDVQHGKALLLAKDVLEKRAYHDAENTGVPWAESALRGFLNGAFFDSFTPDDQRGIVPVMNDDLDNPWFGTNGGSSTEDKIFLLSLNEAVRYLGDAGAKQALDKRQPKALQVDGAHFSERAIAHWRGTPKWWWLRSPGILNHAAGVCADGSLSVKGSRVDFAAGGVRPALWIDLKHVTGGNL